MPADMTSSVCSTFWEKIQIWPTSKCDNKNNDNMVPCGCKAVVKGDISSLGNLFDYKDLMDAWNNETIVSIRRRILNGNYPGESCKDCFLYNLDDGFYKMKCR